MTPLDLSLPVDSSRANGPASILYVSVIVEFLRGHPAFVVWVATLAQAGLWTLIPSLFYSGPPGNVPEVLAVGREFQLGTDLGPPLAFWLAEAAFRATGGHLFGVYLLSQICVIGTYWTVFILGRSIVGAQHAALAVLLMVGISTFTVPSPDFGAAILTMPLWAVVLLHYWRAVGEGRRAYWLPLALEIGLLLLTTYAGLLLIGLLLLFTVANRRGRATFRSIDPWIAAFVSLIVMLPHLLWLFETSSSLTPMLSRLRAPEAVLGNIGAWLWLVTLILAVHAGMLLMVTIVAGLPFARDEPAPVIERRPLDPFARRFVLFFAIVPAFAATLLAVLLGRSTPVGGVAPLVVLSALGVVVAAGDRIALRSQHVVIFAWWGLLIAPAAITIAAMAVLPWVGVDLKVAQPADEISRFFAESFERRTGRPVGIVSGDARTAALVALGVPSRPSVLLLGAAGRSPWVTMDDVKSKGAIVVWPTADTAGTPPDYIRARFPGIVPEVPRTFDRRIQGRLPLIRIGWAVIRPPAGQ